MRAACYALHLYCDAVNPAHVYGEFPHVFSHELGSTCRRRARKRGWRINLNDRDYCPKCRGPIKDPEREWAGGAAAISGIEG